MKIKRVNKYKKLLKYKDSEQLYRIEFIYDNDNEVYISVVKKSVLEALLNKEVEHDY